MSALSRYAKACRNLLAHLLGAGREANKGAKGTRATEESFSGEISRARPRAFCSAGPHRAGRRPGAREAGLDRFLRKGGLFTCLASVISVRPSQLVDLTPMEALDVYLDPPP